MCTSKQALQKTFFKAPSQSVLTFVFTFGYLGKNQEGGEKYVGREKNMTNCALEAHKMGTKTSSKTLSKWLYFT